MIKCWHKVNFYLTYFMFAKKSIVTFIKYVGIYLVFSGHKILLWILSLFHVGQHIVFKLAAQSEPGSSSCSILFGVSRSICTRH